MRSYLAEEIGLNNTVKEIHPLIAYIIGMSFRI